MYGLVYVCKCFMILKSRETIPPCRPHEMTLKSDPHHHDMLCSQILYREKNFTPADVYNMYMIRGYIHIWYMYM